MRAVKLLVMALLVISVASCGYSFRGKQNNLPSDIDTVAIPVFGNNTGEERVEVIVTDEVIFQFTKSQMVAIVSKGEADAILYGTVQKIETEDVSLTATETSANQRVLVTVSAKLVRADNGEVLWQNKNLIQRRIFTVGATAQDTQQNKLTAIDEASKDLAQTLHDSVFENF